MAHGWPPRPAPAGRHRLLLGAVVLTGGTAARLGGLEKAALEVGGVSLLERALAATVAAAEVVVVGARTPTSRPVAWAREDPPGGGPAAGLLAGLDRLDPAIDAVAVLAVDMPFATPLTLERLATALGHDDDGAVLRDSDGRVQPLCAVYRRAALERVRPAHRPDEYGMAVFRLLRGLRLVEVPAQGQEAGDIDTWADLRSLGPGPDGQAD